MSSSSMADDHGPIGLPSADAEPVRLHASTGQRLWMLLTPCVLLAEPLVLDLYFSRPGDDFHPAYWPILPTFALCALVGWVTGWWQGITLTTEGAEVRNFRRRSIRWADVVEVAVEFYGAGGRRIVLYEVDGRFTKLRMPTTAFLAWDRGFDAKVALVRQWWQTNCGDDRPLLDGAAGVEEAEALLLTPMPDRVRLGISWVQAVPVTAALLLVTWEAAVSGLAAPAGSASARGLAVILGSLVVAAVLTALQYYLRAGVLLTPAQLSRTGVLPRSRRRTALAWSEIQAIEVERRFGGRRLVLTDLLGRRTRLAAPRVGFLLWDLDFDRKATAVRRAWLANRGTGLPAVEAAGPPWPGEEPDRYSGPRAWQQAVFTLLCAWLAFTVVVWMLVGGLLAFD